MEFEENHFDATTTADTSGIGTASVGLSSSQSSNALGSTTTITADGISGKSVAKIRSRFYVESGIEALNLESPASQTVFLDNRELYAATLLKKKEHEYVDLRPFTVFCGTWNVNGQSPNEMTRTSMGPNWLACDEFPPDIYAIGFQELDLSKEAFLFSDSPREHEWREACARALHPAATYHEIALIRLIGMMLIVYARKELKGAIKNVHAATVGTGLLGKMGNKGGVAVRFDFHESQLCFVNSHLAAHVEECERRNQDYNDIETRMHFHGELHRIKDHEQIYWFGDLNYRISEMSTEEVKALLDDKDFQTLFSFDQLKRQQKLNKIFNGYNEGDIKFLPSYKYNPGSDHWDSSEKNRPPAWCDRVLWKEKTKKESDAIRLSLYRSHPKLLLSDHKPVSAIFESLIKVKNEEKYRKCYKQCMSDLDRMENEWLPQVSVDKIDLNLGAITFRQEVCCDFTITNTGNNVVQFKFVEKPNQPSGQFCKRWFTVEPSTGTLAPTDSIKIQVNAYVDTDSVARLNAGLDTIGDILVLHLENGRDLFITINGQYLPSCYGSSINALVRLPKAVRDTEEKMFKELLTTKDFNSSQYEMCFDIPKEIWMLTDHLLKNGMDKEDLFQQPGLHTEFNTIRDALDTTNKDTLEQQRHTLNLHSIAESLLVLLETFNEPVIPIALYQRAIEKRTFIDCKKIIAELPEPHRHLFYYLITFMRELINHSIKNKLDKNIIAGVFGSVMIRNPNNSNKAHEKLKQNFIYEFLANDFDV